MERSKSNGFSNPSLLIEECNLHQHCCLESWLIAEREARQTIMSLCIWIYIPSEMQFNDVISWKRSMCVLKVIYGTRCACIRALTIFHGTFWPMLIGEDSKP